MAVFGIGRSAQLARFCIVGLTCYVANIVALAVLCEVLRIHYVVAYIAVFFMGNALGYWLNKRFTFSLSTPLDRAAMTRYLLVNCVMLALSTAALHVLVEWAHIWYLAAVTIIAGVNAPVSFLAHRVVSYRIAT
jgi:putative flippase GtrA